MKKTSHDRKAISKFPHTVSQSFMITAMVRLSHFEKVLLKPEFAEVQTREVLDNFSGSDKLISEYFESQFHLRSC